MVIELVGATAHLTVVDTVSSRELDSWSEPTAALLARLSAPARVDYAAVTGLH